MAADIAVKLTEGYIAPIAAKLDPVIMGEHQRAMQIGYDYGKRLDDMSKSLKPGALLRLVTAYPDHGFVIDRKEATEMFNCVKSPDGETAGLYACARKALLNIAMPRDPLIFDLNAVIHEQEIAKHEDSGKNNGSTTNGTRAPKSGKGQQRGGANDDKKPEIAPKKKSAKKRAVKK